MPCNTVNQVVDIEQQEVEVRWMRPMIGSGCVVQFRQFIETVVLGFVAGPGRNRSASI
jgi:hypothetical protein